MYHRLKVWVHDYLYMIHGAFSSLVYIKPPKHYLGNVLDGKIPVVIIPGIFSKWGIMKKIADSISKLGHPVYIVPKLGYNLYTVPDSSKIVADVIDQEKLTNVILLAHSKGGLIGKHALIHHNKQNKIIGLVAIATPYSGSSMAELIPLDPIQELLKDSHVIKDLDTNTEVNNKIVSICPEYDNHVWSEKGSHLDGAKNILVTVKGHHKIVYDPDVIEIVKQSIEKITQDHFSKI